MKPGIYAGISNENYHGGPGISKSGLDLIHRSPMHYKAVVDAANDNAPTPAQMIGTAAHALILEPAEFVKTYTLALRRQDVPDAIEDREVLVAMVQELNAARLPKLATSGSKDELVARVVGEVGPCAAGDTDLNDLKLAELKAIITKANETRPGLLPISGNRHELAEILRANGRQVTLWTDVEAQWKDNNSHRIVLTQEQWDQVHGMRNAVLNHPAASALLERGKDVVIDLKTTENASAEEFARSIAGWRYHVQHPYYLDGLNEAIRQSGGVIPEAVKNGAAEVSAYWVDEETGVLCRCRPDFWRGEPKNFVFIAVEKKAPHAVGVYVLDSESADLGRAEYRADLDRYAECERTDSWPGYGDKIASISLPRWKLAQAAA